MKLNQALFSFNNCDANWVQNRKRKFIIYNEITGLNPANVEFLVDCSVDTPTGKLSYSDSKTNMNDEFSTKRELYSTRQSLYFKT